MKHWRSSYQIFYAVQQRVSTVLALDTQQKLAATPLPTRGQQLSSLEQYEFDILVIGGGATGCGVALDAVSRGTCG